ncbi:MAG: LuxR C-terminal-related transcriptional regulator [Acidimicrobiales bacterium]
MSGTSLKGATEAEKAANGGDAVGGTSRVVARASGTTSVGPAVARLGRGSTSAVVVDQVPLFRAGVRTVLNRGRCQVLGEAAGVPEGVELARQKQAQVLVLGDAGVKEAAEAVSSLPGRAVVALVARAKRAELLEMLNVGVAGLALRSLATEELVAMVEAVARGDRSVDPALVPLLVGFTGTPDDGTGALASTAQDEPGVEALLTSRERLVLAQLARGASNNKIAETLYVAPATVKTHLEHIYAKLGAAGRYEALAKALELGILH